MLIEQLEARQLLSATLVDGTLRVLGTKAADTIVITLNNKGTRLFAQINGEQTRFNADAVKRIRIDAGAGSDSVRIDEKRGLIRAKVTISGGKGSDTLVGGSKGDVINGGGGHDLILGGGGADILSGGAGNDTIQGNKGSDFIMGDDGDDRLNGGQGHDQIYGGAGNDTIDGGDGADTLGGDGEDRLIFQGGEIPPAQTGNDIIRGGRGNDWILGGTRSDTLNIDDNGSDTITGGPGNDILDIRGGNDVITDREAGDIVPIESSQTIHPNPVHIHALLGIFITEKGQTRQVFIPAGAGDFGIPAVHTHDSSGVIHMHDAPPREFRLGEFMRNWGISLGATNIGRFRAGGKRSLTMTVNGNQNHDFANYVVQDGDVIEIRFS